MECLQGGWKLEKKKTSLSRGRDSLVWGGAFVSALSLKAWTDGGHPFLPDFCSLSHLISFHLASPCALERKEGQSPPCEL